MSNHITLLGAEGVESAGRNIAGAAETMLRAANTIDETASRLASAMDVHATRIEEVLSHLGMSATESPRKVTVLAISHAFGRREIVEKGTAVFHGWGVEHEEYDGGPGNTTVAIIELPDGTVDTVHASLIRFEVSP